MKIKDEKLVDKYRDFFCRHLFKNNKSFVVKSMKNYKRLSNMYGIFAILLIIPTVIILILFDNYANWYIDMIPKEERTILDLLVSAGPFFLVLFIIAALEILLTINVIKCNNAKPYIKRIEKESKIGFKADIMTLADFHENLLNNGYFIENDFYIKSYIEKRKKLKSIIFVGNDIKTVLNKTEEMKNKHSINVDKLLISLVCFGVDTHAVINDFLKKNLDTKELVINTVYVKTDNKKLFAFKPEEYFSKEFCFNSNNILQMLQKNN